MGRNENWKLKRWRGFDRIRTGKVQVPRRITMSRDFDFAMVFRNSSLHEKDEERCQFPKFYIKPIEK